MVILSNFSERLKELMFDNKIKPEQLASAVNVSRSTVYRWITTQNDISLTNLVSLADYFKCTTDFLAGISDDCQTVISKPCPPFCIRMREVLKERGYTTYSLRKVSRFHSIYFQKWDAGESPSLSILIELANLLDCSLDFLIGRE